MSVPAVARDEAAVLDIDRLDVYRAAVEFAALVSRQRITPAGLRDQIDRASASIVLTLAEGIGRISPADRAHFFAMARGSALECAAVLDLLQARGSARISSPPVARPARACGPDADPPDRSAEPAAPFPLGARVMTAGVEIHERA